MNDPSTTHAMIQTMQTWTIIYLYVHVLEYRFSNSRYLWNSTFQIKCFRQDNFENLTQ